MLLLELINDYLENLLKIRRFSNHTYLAYKKDLTEFNNFFVSLNKSYVSEINEKLIRKFVLFINKEEFSKRKKELNANTISRKLSALRGMFEYALQNNFIESNPISNIPNPKINRKLPEILPLDRFNQISVKIEKEYFEAVKQIIDENEKGILEREFKMYNAIFEILYSGSLRVSELCSLNIGDIEFQKRTIRVTGKGSKERIIPVGELSLKILKKYLDLRENLKYNNPVFVTGKNKRIYPKIVYRIVHKYMSEVADLTKMSPHVLRHTSATHMLDRGADLLAVKEILGHENLSTTQIYTHTSIEKLKQVHRSAHPKS